MEVYSFCFVVWGVRMHVFAIEKSYKLLLMSRNGLVSAGVNYGPRKW